MAITNDLSTVMWLFDMSIDVPTYIDSNNKDYLLSVVPHYSYSKRGYPHNQPQTVWVNIHILKNDGDDVYELTGISAEFNNDSDFFDYLKWFQEDPLQLIHDFHQKSPYIKNV